jgi:hypothetical protein
MSERAPHPPDGEAHGRRLLPARSPAEGPRGRSRCVASVLAGLLLIVGGRPGSAASQVPDSLRFPPVVGQDTAQVQAQKHGISPRGAFIRSALIPGWGHVEVGAFVRGGFYFAMEAATGLMLFKTQTRLSRAKDRLGLLESVTTARLQRQGITDPADIEAALADDPDIEDLRALEETRSGQREDWLAVGIFFLFLGGADAYVSAHLAHFPTAVEIGPTPDRGVEVSLSIPLRR